MLNLYLAPRGFRAPVPALAAVTALTDFLAHEAIVGRFEDGAWSPGPAVSRLFYADPRDTHLPAEFTFDALRVVEVSRPRFLPEVRPPGTLRAACGECGDALEPDVVEDALARLRFLAPERVSLTCAACRAVLGVRGLAFEQSVALARFWLFIEGAGLPRINPTLLDRMGRLLGVSLAVIAETPHEAVEDWVPARRGLRRT